MNLLSHSCRLQKAHDGEEIISFGVLLKKSSKTLLYFYPKDNTPGCTLEAQDFSRLKTDFEKKGIQIIGVSKDTSSDHVKFQHSCGLAIDLIADEEGVLCDAFTVLGSKNMYGKMIFGILRSTFLLDQEGNILQEWRSVRATGHAEKVLASL